MEGESKFEQALDAIVTVSLVMGFVYLGDQGTLGPQWVFLGLAGSGAGYGVWKWRSWNSG